MDGWDLTTGDRGREASSSCAGTAFYRATEKFSQASAWNAAICMTNVENGDSTLTLYWR
jgi:hypothetical protein